MDTVKQKTLNFIYKYKVLFITIPIAITAIAITSWWAVFNFMPHPLGEKLDYLGKEDYGNIFGFDYTPASIYYYGTDMDEGEVAAYFKNAHSVEHRIEKSASRLISLKTSNSGFFVDFYKDKKYAPFTTSKKYIISISDSDYNTAKGALK